MEFGSNCRSDPELSKQLQPKALEMPISVNPVLPVTSVQDAAVGSVVSLEALVSAALSASQSGASQGSASQILDATVLKVLSDNWVRIAISDTSVDVLSEVALQPGQILRLAVSQEATGIRLAIVPEAPASAGGPPGFASSSAAAPAASVPAAGETSPLANPSDVTGTRRPPETVVTVASGSVNPAAPRDPLTPAERSAVALASENAAARQGSLAPLFADLAVATGAGPWPTGLQTAMLRVLSLRPNLDGNFGGEDLRSAFQRSGLLLEASLAAEPISTPASLSGSVAKQVLPDLKAALIVLRQTLLNSLPLVGENSQASTARPSSGAPSIVPPDTPEFSLAAQPVRSAPVSPASAASLPMQADLNLDASPTVAPALTLSASVAASELASRLATLPNAAVSTAKLAELLASLPRGTTPDVALRILQEVMQRTPDQADTALSAPSPRQLGLEISTPRPNAPPPPLRDALPTAQQAAASSINANAAQATTLHRLLDDTDAAIARQTLLQIASLPDLRTDSSPNGSNASGARWNFEIPFATPQGTALAQFEIARDDGGAETESSKRVWRARFSLDVEPAGPVHALISLNGERTSVRMWAERPATAAQLRAGAARLSEALRRAELTPGDIVVQDGAPVLPQPARAGHFLDRAS